MNILVTGGAGYIGSHTCVELLAAGHQVVALDNLSNAKRSVVERVQAISGKALAFVEADVRDRAALRAVLAQHRIDAAIHFAGLKAVGDSVAQPLNYYDNNVTGSQVLFECMAEAGVRTCIFSSSATVYGVPATVPILEHFPLAPESPYGRSKLMVEQMLRDVAVADPQWRIGLLRYFNPVGAHASGLIGEDPNGVPNNLMPYIAQVAGGRRAVLSIYGDDYDTPDGTGVRDYIHVVDLAIGHVKALARLAQGAGVRTYNLGSGRGTSVLEMLRAFEAACGHPIAHRFVARRAGDIGSYYADPGLAERELGWKTERGIAEICADAWRWQLASSGA
jgi:UDP-glucose 4-epimerase